MKLPDTIEECHVLIGQLLEVISGLQQRITSLEDQLNQNSRNSHRPPSSDGYRKAALARPKGEAKPGGKKGHEGDTLKKLAEPDKVEALLPQRCEHCRKALNPSSAQLLDSRQVFDIPPIQVECTEYRRLGCECAHCGAYNVGSYPVGVEGPVQYGARIRSFVVMLHQQCCLPVNKIQQLFGDLFDMSINEGAIYSYQQKAYHLLEGEQAYIQGRLQNSKVVHADESGMRVAQRLHWLHTLGNERFTLQFVHPRRGYQAHEHSESFLPKFRNWLVHDFWSPYFQFTKCRHAMCGAHILRELNALSEQGKKWAARFHQLLLGAYHDSNYGRGKIAKRKREQLLVKYRKILRVAHKEEPPAVYQYAKGRAKKSKGRNLLERLEKYSDQVLAFAWHNIVPFTNNLAERDIRPVKSKLKVAGCFRTIDGAQAYARIHSFISTVRKHQANPFNELVRIFQGQLPLYRELYT